MCLVQDERTWNQEENWKEEYKNWLRLLLQLIDMRQHPSPEILLNLFIHGDYSVCQKHKNYIHSEVSTCIDASIIKYEKHFPKM